MSVAGKKPDGFRILDIAAVDDALHTAILDDFENRLDSGVSAVGVANDGDAHAVMIGRQIADCRFQIADSRVSQSDIYDLKSAITVGIPS
jgi:hypothetical protein